MPVSTLRETQDFFAVRATGWEERFPDDNPLFEQAIADLGVPLGAVVLDAGCGTGRALAMLRRAAGQHGRVIALDVTIEMLEVVRAKGRDHLADLVQADGNRLPLATASLDIVF